MERTRLLMRAKRTWEGTFDAIVDPLAIVDRSMRVVRTNTAHAAHAGVDVRSISGRQCHEALFGRAEACSGCPVVRTFETGDTAEGEVSDLHQERVYRAWSFPMSYNPGSDTPDEPFDAAVCHYKDVTDEKELQHKLLQTEKMAAVGTLAGGVAHEINNPLGAILAFSQLGLLDAPPGSTLYEFLSEIERAAQRAKKIVSSLLRFSRPSPGERRPVDLGEVCEQAVFLCRTQYKRAAIGVELDFADDVPRALGDSNQLQQVVVNLVSNAFGALDGQNGTIRLSTALSPTGEVRLRVQDDGPGIPERHLAKVFDPFFTTKAEGKGTGLGLSISYSIIKDHGGTITVESTPSKGACFEILLPRAEES